MMGGDAVDLDASQDVPDVEMVPRPPSVTPVLVSHDPASHTNKRSLERWEPEYFRNLVSRRSDFKFERHVEDKPDDMRQMVEKSHNRPKTRLRHGYPSRLRRSSVP